MRVGDDLCLGCEACIAVCPNGAIEMRQERAWINPSFCCECGACAKVCPQGAIQPAQEVIATEITSQYMSTLSSIRPNLRIASAKDGTQAERERPIYTDASYLSRGILPRIVDPFLSNWENRQNGSLLSLLGTVLSHDPNSSTVPISLDQPFRRRQRFGRRGKGKDQNTTKNQNPKKNQLPDTLWFEPPKG